MNFKGIIIIAEIIYLVFGILVAESNIWFLISGLAFLFPVYNMLFKMADKEIEDAIGYTWLHDKFGFDINE
jgi:hypothetical protein